MGVFADFLLVYFKWFLVEAIVKIVFHLILIVLPRLLETRFFKLEEVDVAQFCPLLFLRLHSIIHSYIFFIIGSAETQLPDLSQHFTWSHALNGHWLICLLLLLYHTTTRGLFQLKWTQKSISCRWWLGISFTLYLLLLYLVICNLGSCFVGGLIPRPTRYAQLSCCCLSIILILRFILLLIVGFT